MQIEAGATDKSIPVVALDSSSTVGAGLAGLAHDTAGLVASYWRQGGSRTAITLATLAAINSAHADGGFKEAEATHLKGTYRLDLPDAALAAGADWVIVEVYGATNMVPFKIKIDLVGFNPQAEPATDTDFAAAVAAQTDIAAALSTIETNLDAPISGIEASISAADIRAALGMASANLDTQLAAIFADTGTDLPATLATIASYLDTEIAAIKAKTDNLPSDPADQSAVEAAILAVMTTAMSEPSYPTAGDTTLSPSQLLFAIFQRLTEFTISGTSIVVRRRDQTTPALTLTTNSATAPSSSTQAA